jgi:hypothetical protein
MIQLHLHHLYCSFLDDWRPDEAEDDLRDAVVQETARLRFDTCPIDEVEEYAAWLCSEQEAADAACDEWNPDDLGELEQALLRRMFDHGNDLRREPNAAE